MFKVTIQGKYWASAGDKRYTLKDYSLDFELPDEYQVGNLALSKIKRDLLVPALQELDPAYHTYKTHEEVDRQDIKEKAAKTEKVEKPVAEMTKKELIQFCLEKGLDVNVQKSGSVKQARLDVQDALDDLDAAEEPAEVDDIEDIDDIAEL